LVANVPTAGFVSLSFDTDWSQKKMAKTKKIIIPKDLKYPSVTNKIH
jgi:hypothetical protein